MPPLAADVPDFRLSLGVRYRLTLTNLPTFAPVAVSDSDRDELARASQAFLREISSFNMLNVKPPEPLAKARDWNLDVVDASGRRDKEVEVVYPHRLPPCIPGETH